MKIFRKNPFGIRGAEKAGIAYTSIGCMSKRFPRHHSAQAILPGVVLVMVFAHQRAQHLERQNGCGLKAIALLGRLGEQSFALLLAERIGVIAVGHVGNCSWVVWVTGVPVCEAGRR